MTGRRKKRATPAREMSYGCTPSVPWFSKSIRFSHPLDNVTWSSVRAEPRPTAHVEVTYRLELWGLSRSDVEAISDLMQKRRR